MPVGKAKIAINALALDETKAGIGNYTYNLIRAMSTLNLNMDIDVHIQGHMNAHFADIQNISFKLHRNFKSNRGRKMYELFKMPSVYRKGNYDIVHFIDCLSPILPINAKRVYTIHDISYSKYKTPFTLWERIIKQIWTRITAKLADRMICISQNAKNELLEQYSFLKKDGIYVTYLAANHIWDHIKSTEDNKSTGELLQKYGIKGKFILYLGTIEPRKNIDVLLKAYEGIIQETDLPHSLVLCGEMVESYNSIIDTLEKNVILKERVILTGYVPDDVLPILYREADVFVYPSLYEGFGLPPLEAMLCKTPVIAANTSSLPEVLGDGALYFHPYDHIELGLLLVGVLSDEEFQKQLKRRGSIQVRKYSWEKTAKETLSIYEDML